MFRFLFKPFLIIVLAGQLVSFNLFAADAGDGSADFMQRLTQQERAWLQTHPNIRVGLMKNWEPISFVDGGNRPLGLSVDYLHAVNQRLGGVLQPVPGEWDRLLEDLKQHKIDVLLDVTRRPSREGSILFTEAYLNIPHIIVARKNAPLIANEAALSGKVLALEKGFGNVEYFQSRYPDVLIHEYAGTEKALEAVASGQADAYAGNRAVAIHLIQKQVLTNLKVHGYLDKPGSVLSLGVRNDWPVLKTILQKALDSLSMEERQTIQSKWVQLNLAKAFRLSEYWPYFILATVFVLALLIWNFYLKKKLSQFQKVIYRQSNFDSLTGLANRYLFQDRLQLAFEQAKRERNAVLVLGCKLNSLDKVRKLKGAHAVDELLKKTARYLSELEEVDTIGRWSESCFVFFVTGLDNQNEIDSLSNSLVKKLIDERRLFASLSVSLNFGGSVFPKDGDDSEEVLGNLFLALDEARRSGTNAFRFFDPEMNAVINRRILLDHAMADSIQTQAFQVYFQPKVDIKSGEIQCFEALLRWFHPEWGAIGPTEFIPVAEESGLIVELGNFVFSEAIREAKKWQETHGRAIRIAVNLSPLQLKVADLVEYVDAQLKAHRLSPELLEVEVTEGVLLSESEDEIQKLLQLKDLGVQLSMDDFGKGYSSLSYLRRYPFDVIKIDKEFVQDLERDPNDRKLIKSIIALAKALGLVVVAEGVETQAQLDFLKRHECDVAQGFYFSAPVSAQEALKMLRS